MNLANLQAFVSVARLGSFSLAAEQLHLTQPAVSKRVVALEESLEARLFDRLGRRVLLTEAGALLLERAEQVLAGLSEVRHRIHDLAGGVRGRLALATSHHIGLHRLPPVLRAFRSGYPEVLLELAFLESEEASAGVLTGSLELAVVTLPQAAEPRLLTQPLWRDTLRVVTARDHPLVARSAVTVTELLRYPAILPGAETVTRQIIEQAFAAHGGAPRVELSTNYLETIRMLVGVGLGWSVLPESLLDERIAVLPVPGLGMQRQLGVVHLRGRTLSNAAQAMQATLRLAADR
ncbi:MAG TPA: LysR family transcriptional regulator [Gammaproteobacteria bacterium]